jgi:hypothetical protein
MRADSPSISAPPFPRNLPWANVAMLRMDQQRDKVVLVEFWDFCRVNSLRTLPYLKAWHARYADAGLRVVGVHTGGFLPARSEDNVRRAVERLEIPWPVAIDFELEVWETELEIQALLGVSRDPVEPIRPEEAEDALVVTPTPDQPGAYSGPYAAGGVWIVAEGAGVVTANGVPIEITEPGCFPVVEHERHTEGELELIPGEGVTVHATCFTVGLAA